MANVRIKARKSSFSFNPEVETRYKRDEQYIEYDNIVRCLVLTNTSTPYKKGFPILSNDKSLIKLY